MTQQQAEEVAHLSPGSLSRYESCQNSISVLAVEKLLQVYGVDDQDKTAALIDLAKEARRRGWLKGIRGVVWPPLEDLVALERDASKIEEFALAVVPGQLQTERYARAVLQGGMLGTDVEQHVQARLDRAAALFDRDDPPEYWVIFRESVLQCVVGSREVMREQLHHLAAMGQRPHITLSVIPNSHGAHPSMTSWFAILSFDLAPDFGVVYLDYPTGSLYRDDPAEVGRYHRMYQHLIKKALPEEQTLDLIAKTAKDLYS